MFISEMGYTEYSVYGFEANPKLCKQVKERFSQYPSVRIENLAISDHNGTENLYLEKGGQGSSIFSTKNNVTEECVLVESILLSDWISTNIPDFSDTYNILRFNIEGAELLLMRDLEASGMINDFDMFLGSDSDIHKVAELVPYLEEYKSILKRHSVVIHYYCRDLRNNASIKDLMEAL